MGNIVTETEPVEVAVVETAMASTGPTTSSGHGFSVKGKITKKGSVIL